jgi:phosphohistidine phosphatase SixA
MFGCAWASYETDPPLAAAAAAAVGTQVPLSARGWEQAVACGNSLRVMMEAEHGPAYKLFFMTSPYCRTRQTFVGIRQAFPDANFAGVQVSMLGG